jgi:hypothetical protein
MGVIRSPGLIRENYLVHAKSFVCPALAALDVWCHTDFKSRNNKTAQDHDEALISAAQS